MSPDLPANSRGRSRTRRMMRAAILLLGLVAVQGVLYGPSLVGRKILLPLELLTDPGTQGGGAQTLMPHDRLLTDPINQIEPMRRFAVSEVRTGRMPLWDPNNYCGAPFLAANQGGVFSPYRILDYLWPDPWALAWGQMLKALVAGIGAYLFFRRAMRVTWWAATIGAWIWPNCGFLVLWTMWPLSAAATWMPWGLLGADRCVRRPGAKSVILLAIFSAFAIVSGHSATGAHVLLASGLYAAWRVVRGLSRRSIYGIGAVLAGWTLGGMLAAPQLLPTLEYMQGSLRMANRLQRGAEVPPVGWSALPQMLLPWIHGSTRSGFIYLGPDNPLESAIAGYAGAITLLVLAPFGFVDRRRRADQLFWLGLAIVAAAYVLDLPGGWWVSRLPVLQSLRGNRMILISGFAIVSMGVLGLDVLLRGRARRSPWLMLAPAASIALAGWCIWRATNMNDLIAQKAAPALQAQSAGVGTFRAMIDAVSELSQRFQFVHWGYAALCLAAAVLLGLLWRWPNKRLAIAVGFFAVAEVVITAWRVNPQSDRVLYNWKLPAFEAIAQSEPGRICGVLCLPPMFNRWGGLPDIRGYDAADPLRAVQAILQLAAPGSPPPDPSAATYALNPRYPSPLADFLNVRYLIAPGQPQNPGVAKFITPGFFVIENPTALPRVTIPKQAIVVEDDAERLRMLGDPSFNPRVSVLLEKPAAKMSDLDGTARIVKETPSRVEIEYTSQNGGLVVLADTWDKGWHATVNGSAAEVLRANHAFRAVSVAAGSGSIVFTYWPRSFTIGLILMGLSAGACLLILAIRIRGARIMKP